ncbi:hypothetical protein FNJ84_16255 [Paracoccus sp. M683]|uniref:hypothetical protein n=1 Tax=Paracoccus sp. M683 TaxID=2594268 RepID=UPI00117C2567|nr:hypothetical protein [Paracoccus sp. M683]TRW95279.1 hypothetical protein FNJ84_16255 [Paracoccus sp. M683]
MQQDDAWSLGGTVRSEPEARARVSLEQGLLALDHKAAPVFAVLDGAQFDNLPQELMMGGFVSRSLYLDRGDNNPEQIITAPHMVWLDERPEKIGGRAPEITIPALLDLIVARPAAVFWQCPDGANALYRHLRGINMVLYPKAALPDFEEPDTLPGDGDVFPAAPDTHTLVLFRHADSNVIAQSLPALEPAHLARLFGPATAILAMPEREWSWSDAPLFAARPDGLPAAPPGPLRLSQAELDGISQAAERASQQRIVAYLGAAAPQYTDRLQPQQLHQLTDAAIRDGRQIGLRTEKGFGLLAMLSLLTGGELLRDQRFMSGIANDPRPSDEVLDEVFDDIANMSKSDLAALTP